MGPWENNKQIRVSGNKYARIYKVDFKRRNSLT